MSDPIVGSFFPFGGVSVGVGAVVVDDGGFDTSALSTDQ
jgi:hypothetical protein